MRTAGGFALVELIVALMLGVLVCGVIAGALTTVERTARFQAALVSRAETVRVATLSLHAELRGLDPRADIRVVSRDSVGLRAFRGIGVVCGSAAGAALVRYHGQREPEPAKDSVVAVLGNGPDQVLELTFVSGGTGCPVATGEAVQRWSFATGTPPVGALLLLFESGSYHLSDAALRYRRGSAGRQPLTPENLLAGSGFGVWIPAAANHPAGMEVHLRFRDLPVGPSAGSPAVPPLTRLWIPHLNDRLAGRGERSGS